MKSLIAAGATVKAAASLLFAALFMSLCTPVHAQQYPVRPIRLVIPWPPGGITDVISRTMAAALSESLGQQVVPDNRPGAAGTLGVSIGAHAQPDGYTLIMTDVPSHAISATLYKKLHFDSVKDVEPIALPSRSPLVLVVNPKLGVKTTAQLIEQAKARPGQVSFASSGPGSITHLTAERFIAETGVKLLHVPYKGSGPALSELLGGQVETMIDQLAASIGYVRDGRLKVLAVTTQQRAAALPNVPTLEELGYKGYQAATLLGLLAPAGTPKPVVAKLNAGVRKIMENNAVAERFRGLGANPGASSPEEFTTRIRDELEQWRTLVKQLNLKFE